MEGLLLWSGRLAGGVGVAVTLFAFAVRLTGAYFIAGFQVGTLLQAGIAAMLMACLAHLVVLAERTGADRR